MNKLLKLLIAAVLLSAIASGQTTTTVTGTIRDLSQAVVATGQVTFDLRPSLDSTISGFARFVPSTITCSINQATAGASSAVRAANSVTISGLTGHTFVANDVITVTGMTDSSFNGTFTIGSITAASVTYPQTAGGATTGSGVISALRSTPGPGSCTITMNTALNPAGTSYKICAQPQFITPGSCWNDYAILATKDISTVIPTPTTSPAYTFVDLHSAQTITGAKTFTGSTAFNGSLTMGALSASSATISGNATVGGTFGATGTSTLGTVVAGAVSATQVTNTGDTLLSSGKVIKWNADTGLSRDVAGVVDCGNGTQGDKSCNLKLATVTLGKSDGTLPATFTNDTAGGINFTSNSGKTLELNTQAQLVFFGATSGTTILMPTGVASGTLTLPSATDTLVGKATTDTLTNKTLTGAGSGNAVTLLNEQGPAAEINGTGSAVTVFTYTLPANTMQAGKGIRIKYWANHSTGAAAITHQLTFGGTAYFSVADSGATGQVYVEVNIFNNSGVTNAQHGSTAAANYPGVAGTSNSGITSAIDTTADITVKATFNVAAGTKVTPGQWIVELIR